LATKRQTIEFASRLGKSVLSDARLLASNLAPSIWGTLVPVLLAAIAPVLMYHRVYLKPLGHEAYFYGDTVGSYWPDLVYFVRTLAHAEFPLWCPNERGGIPFAFDPQTGVLYPVNWLLAAVGLVIGRTPYALFEFKILVHLSLATIGWYAWLRCRLSQPAALVGAIAGGLGLYTIQNGHFGLIWPITWVPWALLSLHKWLATRSVVPMFAFGASVGALFAAGSPPGALYGALAIAGIGAPQVVRELFILPNGERKKLLVSGLIGASVASILALPVVLGSQILTGQSVLEKRDYAYFSGAPLWLSDWGLLISPAAHGLSMYAGVAIVTLAIIGICRSSLRLLTASAFAVGAFGLLMALGDQTPVAAWTYAHFLPVRYFRLIFRYLYLVQAGLAVLAAVGAEELLSSGRRCRWAFASLSLLAACIAGLVWASRSGNVQIDQGLSLRRSGTLYWLAFVWIAALVSLVVRIRVLRLVVLSAIVLADLSLAVPSANTLRDGTFSVPSQVSSEALTQILKETQSYRVWDEFALAYRPGSRVGVRDLRGYMDPLRLAHYDTMVAHLWNAPLLLERWNVRWVLPAPLPHLGGSHNRVDVRKLSSIARRIEPHVLELPEPRARAVFTPRVQIPKTEDQLWSTLEKDPLGAPLQLPPRTDTQTPEVGIATDGGVFPPVSDKPAILLERKSNSLSFSVDAPIDGWLVVNEAYFPGWTAVVDGNPTPVYRVDGWVRGLRIPKGVHLVGLAFRPTSWLIAASAAIIVWLGLAMMSYQALLLPMRHKRTSFRSAKSAG
jgi:hypothetical protein